MNKLVLVAALFIIFRSVSVAQNNNSFFDRYDQFLKLYTKNGNIDFEKLKTESTLLNEIYNEIGKTDLSNKDDAFRKAFLINAYNIMVIKQEQVFYPIKSPNEVNGFFDNITHVVAGSEYTLDALEKQMLLKEFPDPRVHLVLVCGAKGCPKLLNKAYRS